MTHNELSQIIDSLIALGEDPDELKFWKAIYPDLSANDQKELRDNLTMELKKLRGPQKTTS